MRSSIRNPWLLVVLLTLGGVAAGLAMADARHHKRVKTAQASRSRIMSARTYQKPSDAELKQKLSAIEYQVTQREGTEPPFRNAFWNHHEAGLYVDVATGEPLFASVHKFDSGTGWPSFTQPVESNRVVERTDRSHGTVRTEVRSRGGDSHLGHVFDDGPPPTGRRYCINSAALSFVPVERLEVEGYGDYRPMFEAAEAPAFTSAAGDGGAGPGQINACVTPADAQPGCAATLDTVVLAGGCFWGMEDLLRQIPGVLETEVGYIGGTTPKPRYDDVRTGRTGHAEAVRVVFDASQLSFEDLLEKGFFRMHDPTTLNQQGNDVGTQYRSVIFVASPEQRKVAEEVKARVERSGKWKRPVVTQIVEAGAFTRAEDYHQAYLQKNPGGYTCHFIRD